MAQVNQVDSGEQCALMLAANGSCSLRSVVRVISGGMGDEYLYDSASPDASLVDVTLIAMVVFELLEVSLGAFFVDLAVFLN